MTDTRHEPGLPAYRPDIDGLRAIAVAAVMLFHAGVPGFSGGYAGVDIFFVISGYLITRLLLEDAHGRRRGLADFYLRRGRRILPALFVVALVSALVACIVLLPADLTRFGKYLATTPSMLVNWAAWSEGGYFAGGHPPVPLTHLWSIAVEEQFYLLYPVVLLGVLKLSPRYRPWALAGLGAASLAVCFWASSHRPVVNYYAAPTRAWELLLGAGVAFGAFRGFVRRGVNETLGALSVLIIGLTVALLDPTVPYPGPRTLPVCIATVLLIATAETQSTRVATLLSSRPLVLIGLISYSLYLWHLPVFAFVHYYAIQPPGGVTVCLMLAITCLLAWVSWLVIERPVRTRRLLHSDRMFVACAAAVGVVIIATGLLLRGSGGLPWRFPAQVTALQDTTHSMHPDMRRCIGLSAAAIRSGGVCRFGPQGADHRRVFVWGDSHAMALLPAFEKLATEQGVQVYFAAASACLPLLDVGSRKSPVIRRNCAQFNASVVEAVRRIDPDTVILVGYWDFLAGLLVPAAHSRVPAGESLLQWGLGQTLRQVAAPKRALCAVLDVPTLKVLAPYALAMARRRGIDDSFIAVSRSDALAQSRMTASDIEPYEKSGALRIVDLKEGLCPGRSCAYKTGELPLYRDTNHLTVAGALLVAPVLEKCIHPPAGSILARLDSRP